MIDGVVLTPLRKIPDERGNVMHMLRADSPVFVQFGEIYFSSVFAGAVKAWHLHKEMILNYAVPHGSIKFVLYDDRPDSPTHGKVQTLFPGVGNYCLITVPPGIWSGFQGLGDETSIVANCASLPHDPAEIVRKPAATSDIPYCWDTEF